MVTFTREQFLDGIAPDVQHVLLDMINQMHEPHKGQDYETLSRLQPPANVMKRMFFIKLETMHIGVMMAFWLNDDGHIVGRILNVYIYTGEAESMIEQAKVRGITTTDKTVLN